MKCNEARDAVLLEQSGELEAQDREALNTHLEACAECRTYREDLNAMMSATQQTTLESDVSEFTIRRIVAAGERAHSPAGRRQAAGGRFIELWRPALMSGAAALLLIFFGIQFAQHTTTPVESGSGSYAAVETQEADLLAWDLDLDDELEEITTLLAMATDETTNGSQTQDNGSSLDELAEELEWESWNI